MKHGTDMVNIPHPSSGLDSSIWKSTVTYMLGLEVGGFGFVSQVTLLTDSVSPRMSWGTERGI